MMTNPCTKCILPINSRFNLDDLTSLPYLNITSVSITSAPSLMGPDGDVFIPSRNLDFKYYTPHSFHDSPAIKEAFLSKSVLSLFHCNIRSLGANHDNLVSMLFELYYPFSIIGISETKFTHKKDSLINIDIPHYNFLLYLILVVLGFLCMKT